MKYSTDVRMKIIDLIAEVTDFSKDDIDRHILTDYVPNKGQFVLFFNKFSKTPETAAKSTQECLEERRSPLISEIKINNKTGISIYLNKSYFIEDILTTIIEEGNEYGSNKNCLNKKVVLEYSSPNVAKMFHVGHFRNTMLGNFIDNLLRANGYETVTVNYLGDWGRQFGLVIAGYLEIGSEKKLQDCPLEHLVEIYVEVNKEIEKYESKALGIFEELENNPQSEYFKLFNLFRAKSIVKYKQLYEKLNISFNVYSGESMYVQKGKELCRTLDFITLDDDGSKIVDCSPYGNLVLQKNNGCSLYSTRDLAAFIDRMEKFKPDLMIYVVASQQDLYFKQLFSIFERLGYSKNTFRHVNYGLVKGMSTRKGKGHFIEDIIDTAKVAIQEIIQKKEENLDEETITILALSFLVVEDFSAKRVKGYEFSIEERAKTERGEALGIKFQYTHCRLNSLRKINCHYDLTDLSRIDWSYIKDNDKMVDLVYKLLWFQNVVEITLNDFEPTRIVLYLTDICNSVNSLLSTCRVKGSPEHIGRALLIVFESSRIVLHNGLSLLGLEPLNSM